MEVLMTMVRPASDAGSHTGTPAISPARSEELDFAYYDLIDYPHIVERSHAAHHKGPVQDMLRRLLAGCHGRVLDLACGSGVNFELLLDIGFEVVGTDISESQLQAAQARLSGPRTLLADAACLPLESGSFDVVISCYTHTDLPDWAAAMREVARVLRPGGRFVYVGPHLCFFGGQAEKLHDGRLVIHPGYYHNATTRVFDAPGFSPNGLRRTVGEVHLSQQSFYNAIFRAGLRIDRIVEDSQDPPTFFGLAASTD